MTRIRATFTGDGRLEASVSGPLHSEAMSTDSPSPAFGTMPAAAVIAELMSVQRDVPSRSRAARLFGRSPLSPQSRPWYVGALGELEVARRLEALGAEWTVRHAVPVGTRGSDIDHIVLGPAGVFTINTKFHEDARIWVSSRQLRVNGQPKDHLRNARYEAQRVAKILTAATDTTVTVSPMVVIVGAKDITIREQPADVAVVRETQVVRRLRSSPPTLSPDQLATIAAVLVDRGTWTTTPADRPDVTPAFAELRREVRSAKRVRLTWALAALGGGTALILAFASGAFVSLLGG